MGNDADAASSPVKYAASNVRYLAAAQTGLRARPSGPSGHTRSPEAPAPIDLGILDYMVSARAELVEHTRTHADTTVPVPSAQADVYAWYGQNRTHLDEEAFRAGEAIIYRQSLEARILAREIRDFWPERCPSCSCFSLRWHPALQAAVCLNTKYDSEDGAPRRFTLGQIAENAVENLTIRAAT
jgi:hypothetical protein